MNSAKLLRAEFAFPEFCGKQAEPNFTETHPILNAHGSMITLVFDTVKQHISKSSQTTELKA